MHPLDVVRTRRRRIHLSRQDDPSVQGGSSIRICRRISRRREQARREIGGTRAPFSPNGGCMTNALPRPGGLIFDLDGTLVDTVAARIDGWVEALEAAGVAGTGEQIAPMIGMDGRRLAREVAEAAGLSLDAHAVEAVDKAAGEAFDRRNLAPEPL